MILDTEFIIRLRRGDGAAVDVSGDLEARHVPTGVPTVVVQELYVGVGAGDQPPIENQRDYEAIVANVPIVGLDENVARRAGLLQGRHQAIDTKPDLGTVDAVTAASGLTLNEAVVSPDSDFRSVDGPAVDPV